MSLRSTYTQPVEIAIPLYSSPLYNRPRKSTAPRVFRTIQKDNFNGLLRRVAPFAISILLALILYNGIASTLRSRRAPPPPVMEQFIEHESTFQTSPGKDAILSVGKLAERVERAIEEKIARNARDTLNYVEKIESDPVEQKITNKGQGSRITADRFHSSSIFNPWGVDTVESACDKLHCSADQVCYSLPRVKVMCADPDHACSTLSEDICATEPGCSLHFAKSCTSGESLGFCRATGAKCESGPAMCAQHPDSLEVFRFSDACMPSYRNVYSLKEVGQQFEPVESAQCCAPSS